MLYARSPTAAAPRQPAQSAWPLDVYYVPATKKDGGGGVGGGGGDGVSSGGGVGGGQAGADRHSRCGRSNLLSFLKLAHGRGLHSGGGGGRSVSVVVGRSSSTAMEVPVPIACLLLLTCRYDPAGRSSIRLDLTPTLQQPSSYPPTLIPVAAHQSSPARAG